MGQDAVQDLGLSPRDRFVRLREFLDVVDAGRKRVMIALRGPYGEHVQDDMGVLRVVLVPAIVERLPGSGERQGRDEADIEPSLEQAPCDRPMVVAGRLEPAGDGTAEFHKQGHEAIMLGLRVEHRQSTATGMTRDLDQHLVASFGDVDRHENDVIGNSMWLGHGRSISGMRLRTPSL